MAREQSTRSPGPPVDAPDLSAALNSAAGARIAQKLADQDRRQARQWLARMGQQAGPPRPGARRAVGRASAAVVLTGILATSVSTQAAAHESGPHAATPAARPTAGAVMRPSFCLPEPEPVSGRDYVCGDDMPTPPYCPPPPGVQDLSDLDLPPSTPDPCWMFSPMNVPVGPIGPNRPGGSGQDNGGGPGAGTTGSMFPQGLPPGGGSGLPGDVPVSAQRASSPDGGDGAATGAGGGDSAVPGAGATGAGDAVSPENGPAGQAADDAPAAPGADGTPGAADNPFRRRVFITPDGRFLVDGLSPELDGGNPPPPGAVEQEEDPRQEPAPVNDWFRKERDKKLPERISEVADQAGQVAKGFTHGTTHVGKPDVSPGTGGPEPVQDVHDPVLSGAFCLYALCEGGKAAWNRITGKQPATQGPVGQPETGYDTTDRNGRSQNPNGNPGPEPPADTTSTRQGTPPEGSAGAGGPDATAPADPGPGATAGEGPTGQPGQPGPAGQPEPESGRPAGQPGAPEGQPGEPQSSGPSADEVGDGVARGIGAGTRFLSRATGPVGQAVGTGVGGFEGAAWEGTLHSDLIRPDGMSQNTWEAVQQAGPEGGFLPLAFSDDPPPPPKSPEQKQQDLDKWMNLVGQGFMKGSGLDGLDSPDQPAPGSPPDNGAGSTPMVPTGPDRTMRPEPAGLANTGDPGLPPGLRFPQGQDQGQPPIPGPLGDQPQPNDQQPGPQGQTGPSAPADQHPQGDHPSDNQQPPGDQSKPGGPNDPGLPPGLRFPQGQDQGQPPIPGPLGDHPQDPPPPDQHPQDQHPQDQPPQNPPQGDQHAPDNAQPGNPAGPPGGDAPANPPANPPSPANPPADPPAAPPAPDNGGAPGGGGPADAPVGNAPTT